MRNTLSFAAALALVACTPAPEPDPAQDYNGNPYPSWCPASIRLKPENRMLMLYVPLQRNEGGKAYYNPDSRQKYLIVLNSNHAGWVLEDDERHEACHIETHRLYGTLDWPGHCKHQMGCSKPPPKPLGDPNHTFGGTF